MTYQFRSLTERAVADGRIDADEVLALRRAGWADGRIEPAEAEALFAANDALVERGTDWVDFFVEALVEYLLAGGSPRGFVSEDQAEWLISRLDKAGQVETMAELELLATLFDKAEAVPSRLKDYALAQIEQIVLTGNGPTRKGAAVTGACVTDAECRLLKRFVFAPAGDTPGGVSQAEAEMLFRIKDATLGGDNAPEWTDLFVRAVANHLMGHHRFVPLSADRARQLEHFMNDSTPRFGAFLSRIANAPLGMPGALKRMWGGGDKAPVYDLAHEVADDARVTELEESWLQTQVDANHALDPLDKALLRFIAEERQAH